VVNRSSSGQKPPGSYGGEAGGEGLKSEGDDNSFKDRVKAVEEGDIVKLQGSHLYILSRYRGLVVIDVSDPTSPYIISSLRLRGHPVEMYVHEPLAVVILSGRYSFEGGAKTLVAVLNLKDLPRIRIVKYIEVKGIATVSRLVGDTLYLATIDEMYYVTPYMEGVDVRLGGEAVDYPGGSERTRTVRITAINLASPLRLGIVNSATFSGDSVQVHATPTAVFVAVGKMEEGRWGVWNTDIIYVDITSGDVRVRGRIALKGAVWDKYQMDYYAGSLRVVTHERDKGTSHLHLIDVRNPRVLKEISSLTIPDAGNLMAMRFDGKRAYLIHLPHAPDPLRVVDLTDPTSPELCSVLEIPGWVAHLEPLGDWIVAVGVNTEEGWRASIYLFYVKDPYHPELKDTKDVGEFYTYSEAVWEPKAVTMIKERSMIVIPYDSYSWKWGGTLHGLFLVKYDLTNGKLNVAGDVNCPEVIRRSRVKGDYLLGTSDTIMVTINLEGAPGLKAILPLVENVVGIEESQSGVVMLSFKAGSAYLKHINDDGVVGEFLLRENVSRYYYHQLFTVGNKVMVVLGNYYKGTTEIYLLRSEPLELLDSVELGGDRSLFINKPLMVGERMLIVARGGWYVEERATEERQDEDEEVAYEEAEKLPEEKKGSYLLSFPEDKIVVEEVNFTWYGTGSLFTLSGSLYGFVPERGRYASYELYRIDLRNFTEERLGVVEGWYITADDTYLFTEYWNGEGETLNVYYLNGSTFHLHGNISLPFWGDVRYSSGTIYVVYNNYYRWLTLEGSDYVPGTIVCAMDIKSMGIRRCVRVNGSYFYSPVVAVKEGLLLYYSEADTWLLTLLDEENLNARFTLQLSTYPQGVVLKGGKIYVGQGLYGYIVGSIEK
ncbi:MAG: beta-propeller domain-containing protein, partial [Thermoplasmata archaeon]|nr:beta-propeller domain-containing protein [Thermoplasmata archaeon]